MELPYSNMRLKQWNPGATMPLILPVHVICNTSDESIYDNIRTNSRNHGGWLNETAAHNGKAIICGSGPSIRESLDEIRAMHAEPGAAIFALNGCARFLHENGIMPDYQVLIDAREETADLIGPAYWHLIASQCHPECFARADNPILYHLQVTGIDDCLPDYPNPFNLIGGAASVGNTTGPLAHTIGFRDLHYFGLDSSNKGQETHAFHQPMNDGDPMASVMFKAKEYTASLTMKLQAEQFMITRRALQEAGSKVTVHGYGLLPDMVAASEIAMSDVEIYREVWTHRRYRETAPGVACVQTFLAVAKPEGRVLDYGCGTGRAGWAIREAGIDVLQLDFADNCRDPQPHPLPFMVTDLREAIPIKGAFGFCTDVMEHIAPEDVETVIDNIMMATPRAFFQISTVPDQLGVALLGRSLHLTVQPHQWWLDTFSRLGFVVKWRQKDEVSSLFYVEVIERQAEAAA